MHLLKHVAQQVKHDVQLVKDAVQLVKHTAHCADSNARRAIVFRTPPNDMPKPSCFPVEEDSFSDEIHLATSHN